MSCVLTVSERIFPSKPPFIGSIPPSDLRRQVSGVQQPWSHVTHGFHHSLPVKALLSFPVTRWDLVARESARFAKCRWLKWSNLVRLPFSRTSNMSTAPLASRFSTLKVVDDFDEQGQRLASLPNSGRRNDASDGDTTGSAHLTELGLQQSRPIKRPFCKKCDKAALLCICHHVKTVVENKTSIIILQHPNEKKHYLGSARIALLALQNVEILNIPEAHQPFSPRVRDKVPGSKRSIAGRGGKNSENVTEELKQKNLLPQCPEVLPALAFNSERQRWSQPSPDLTSGDGSLLEWNSALGADHRLIQCSTVPPWIRLQPDVGLLFPSEMAVDLWPAGLGLIAMSSDSELTFTCKVGSTSIDGEGRSVPSNSPSQLIVLDGTWSKAKRIFFENPWLHSLPHYRLPTLQGSRYGRLRREPKPGFVSTVESIVYALQLLEPETHGLESLLDVFSSMINDQIRVEGGRVRGRYRAKDNSV